jgi:hypothetical protein
MMAVSRTMVNGLETATPLLRVDTLAGPPCDS